MFKQSRGLASTEDPNTVHKGPGPLVTGDIDATHTPSISINSAATSTLDRNKNNVRKSNINSELARYLNSDADYRDLLELTFKQFKEQDSMVYSEATPGLTTGSKQQSAAKESQKLRSRLRNHVGLDDVAKQLQASINADSSLEHKRKLFHFLISEFTAQEQYQPAEIALDCLIDSGLELNIVSFLLAVKLSVHSRNAPNFFQYMQRLDLSKHTGAIKHRKMSQLSATPPEWCSRAKRHRATHSQRRRANQLVEQSLPSADMTHDSADANGTTKAYKAVFAAMIRGFHIYDDHASLDIAINHLISQNVELSDEILDTNIMAAIKLNDPIRYDWTVEYIEREQHDASVKLAQTLQTAHAKFQNIQ